MIHLKHIKSKKVIIKTNKDANTILNSPLGEKYEVIKEDKPVETPPEVKQKVSITPKAQEAKVKSNKNANR